MSKINEEISCAASDMIDDWENIDFLKAENYVKKLQKRIAIAFSNDDFDKMTYLQHTLIHSFYAKALAVRTVTSNKGKNTCGIDNILWDTPEKKFQAVFELNRRGYKSKPLKRIYIPKSNGNKRPLGIPTMKDRAMQTIYKFALEPIAEASGDENSFGFRKNRSAKDAVRKCIEILSGNSNQWVLKTDIESCFENISHEWVLNHIPLDKKVLYQFLKSGYLEGSIYHSADKGIPQGGSISSVICNMVLDGIECCLLNKFGKDVHMIRYADDIIIVADSFSFLVQSIVPEINLFLIERGLRLSSEKTKVVHISNGFDFLGCRICIRRNQIISVPLRKNVDSLLDKINRELTVISDRELDDLSYDVVEALGNALKQYIRGWINYYDNIVTAQSLVQVKDKILCQVMQLTRDNRIADFIKRLFNQKEL